MLYVFVFIQGVKVWGLRILKSQRRGLSEGSGSRLWLSSLPKVSVHSLLNETDALKPEALKDMSDPSKNFYSPKTSATDSVRRAFTVQGLRVLAGCSFRAVLLRRSTTGLNARSSL